MNNSFCQRNLLQNFVLDSGVYRINANPSIQTSRQSRIPSFKNAPPISTPSSPREQKSMWKTNICFQNDQSLICNKDKSPDSKSQKKSISPQLYSITRKPFQLQLGAVEKVLIQLPKSKEKRTIRNSIYSRPTSRLVEDSLIVQQAAADLEINRNSFKYHYILGKGGFGKVWKVELIKARKLYAMKEMSKAKVMAKKSVNSVMNERLLLSQLKHPFIANIHYAFQDREHLYLVMDLLSGGDLRYHIGKMRRFSEQHTSNTVRFILEFIIGSILLALTYLHSNGIIHRDIKPENIVLDKNGYPRLTDFGIARIIKPENSQETSGTPGYMGIRLNDILIAPEVMFKQNHNIGVDHYALGVMMYEFMMGKRPYLGKTRKDIRDAIIAKQVQLKKNEIPFGWSLEAADLTNQLLSRKPQIRLGSKGTEQICSHQWFEGFPWKNLYDKQLTSPFKILKSCEESYIREISSEHDSLDQEIKENSVLLRQETIQNLFINYSYIKEQQKTLKRF